MDLWHGFACHCLDLTKQNGILAFIAQNNWTTNAGAKKMRKKIIEESQILQMTDFSDYMIFKHETTNSKKSDDGASIQTMVMLFKHSADIDNYSFDYRSIVKGNRKSEKRDMLDLLNKTQTRKTYYLAPTINRTYYTNRFLTFSGNDDILNKIAKNKVYFKDEEIAQGIVFPQDFLDKKNQLKLGRYCVGDGIFGLSEGEKNNLELTAEEQKLIKPYFTTEQIHRYFTEKHNRLWLIYTNSSFKQLNSMDAYPNLKKHLDKFSDIITSDNKPYGLHRARKEQFFKGEKIISQRKCAEHPTFSYSDFDCYVTQTFFIIKTLRWNMKFLTGLLNSKVIAYWLRHRGKMQGVNYQVDKEPLRNIPLPLVLKNQQQPVIALVNQILQVKKVNPEACTNSLEIKIDKLTYKLYGLTDKEIKIIEGQKI